MQLFKESIRAASVDSAASDATHIRSLENKLHATMQILQNKEETIRVQAESLALAEARIAALISKAQSLPKIHQTQQTSLFKTRNSADGNHVEMADVSCTAQIKEVDHTIVKTLRDNLSMIEELYRECFYETAKQEELITVLRRSYLDMRLEKKQCDQTSLVWQRNSMEKYQDIALEVERLKSEITSFLNNSTNNDSTECTCGLEEENTRLKKLNETMEIQVGELRQRVTELEEALEGKEDQDQQLQLQITEKEQELQHIRQQLFDIEQSSRERVDSCDSLTLQVKDLEELLNDKAVELFNVQHQCESQEVVIKQLREELQTAEAMAKDNVATRAEVGELSEQVRSWRAQLREGRGRLRALDAQLRRARAHCRRLADLYQYGILLLNNESAEWEKAELASELQSQLHEAQRRGAALCAQAQRAVCGVRRWLRVQRDRHSQQEEKIKQQELLIRSFQSHNSNTESASENDPCCSRYLHEPRPSDVSRVRASETASSSYLNETRRHDASSFRTSETCPQFLEDTSRVRMSETTCSKCARVSETDSPSPPTPPVRLLRKKSANGDKAQCMEGARTREAGVQRPQRRDAATARALSREHIYFYPHSSSNEVSPPEELLQRVERAHAALADARRRWRSPL
ncbi:unnamed protein product, partial [Brenthis ino]